MDANTINNKEKVTLENLEFSDFIRALWDGKILIIGITLVLAIASAIVSTFFITPVYKTTFSVVVNVPDKFSTKYGEYTPAITGNKNYINLIKHNEVLRQTIVDMGLNPVEVPVESFSNRITIGEIAKDENIYPITISGSDPVEMVRISRTLYDNFTKHIDTNIKYGAINHFYEDFTLKQETNNKDIQSKNDLLQRQEELLGEISPVIDQEEALKMISGSSNYIIFEDLVNPNYTSLENEILDINKSINLLNNNKEKYTAYLEELTIEKANIEKYFQSANQEQFETAIINNPDIFMLSEPIVPTYQESPNTRRNVILAGIFGLFISGVVLFFREYMKQA